jgi:hypothetical protein
MIEILNREYRNDPDLVQAFLKKWWVESSRFHYGSNAMRFKRSLERMNKKFLNFQSSQFSGC